jgi:FKBP-type peptidyl-prolyl cis-trans isomerase 2
MGKKSYFGNYRSNKIKVIDTCQFKKRRTKLQPDIERELREREKAAEVKDLRDPKVRVTVDKKIFPYNI